MQMYEFSSEIENHGIIHIPKQYLENIVSPVRVVIFAGKKAQNSKKKHFSAMNLKTKGFKFDRETANER
jgi:hypothetical protein